jgi:hypothetical protein
MGTLLDRLKTGSPDYAVEMAGDGFVLVRREDHCDEFNRLVRELLNRNSEEFVILPVTDGGKGYDRAIILPI